MFLQRFQEGDEIVLVLVREVQAAITKLREYLVGHGGVVVSFENFG